MASRTQHPIAYSQLTLTFGVLIALTASLLSNSALAQIKSGSTQKLDLTSARTLRVLPNGERQLDPVELSTSVNCTSRHDSGAYWSIDEWLIGNELYKSYQDPVAACGGAYPYTVTEVHMFLQMQTAATISIAIDLEHIDYDFLPGCPVPGDMIYLGPLLDVSFPSAGLYDLTIQLDTPRVVNGPFFVGFFFGSAINPAWHMSLVTDNYSAECVSFNIWDTTLGYIDLCNDVMVHEAVYSSGDPCHNAPPEDPNCFDFDGRLLLYTKGVLADQTSCCDLAGDADNSGKVNIGDVTYLIAYAFGGGPAPTCMAEGDADGDSKVNIGDVTRIIARVFSGETAPVCGGSAG